MKVQLVGHRRKDGKQKVKYIFEGGPNGFGGHYSGKTITKILTLDEVKKAFEEAQQS